MARLPLTRAASAAMAVAVAALPPLAAAHTSDGGHGHSHVWRFAHDVSMAFSGPAAAGAPEQIWISYGAAPSQMSVTWSTNATADAVVRFGPAGGTLSSSATGNTTQYSASFGTYTSAFIHHATLTGLSPGARMSYQVAGPAGTWSDVFNFTSSRGVGASIFPYRLGVIGDIGQTNNSNATANWLVAAANVESVVIAGDLSYADGDQV